MNLGFRLDIERCSGCFACVVACMDQNNLNPEAGDPAFRQVVRVERGGRQQVPQQVPQQIPQPMQIRYVSLACMNCESAPCELACPTGAISRDPMTGIVYVRAEACIGCHSCSMACPFGVPRFGADGRMQKCDLCLERVAAGHEPACSRVCPTGALQFGDVNELTAQQLARAADRAAEASGLPSGGPGR